MRKKRELTGPERIALNMRLDVAAIMWRTMLEKKIDLKKLSQKSKMQIHVVNSMLHARRNATVDEVGAIAFGLGIRLDFQGRYL